MTELEQKEVESFYFELKKLDANFIRIKDKKKWRRMKEILLKTEKPERTITCGASALYKIITEYDTNPAFISDPKYKKLRSIF